MRHLALSIAAYVLLGAAILRTDGDGVLAASSQAHPRTIATTFRLHVSGRAAPGTTYWVAYGPLEGKWGIVQLHPAGNGLETATRVLPAAGRSVFAYLAGHGAIRTRAGLVPGDPEYTIRRVGPMSPAQVTRTTVQWRSPVG